MRTAFAGLSVRQPARGYRFSVDAVLLADFAAGICGESVLDLGTGCGIVLLLLSRLCPRLGRGVGVEIQRELWECAETNFAENHVEGTISAVHGDFRRSAVIDAYGPFDLVVSNPPFRRAGAGRTNPDPQKTIARHEVACTLEDVFRAARRNLSAEGRFAMIGLPGRLPEILACSEAEGIFPERIRFVHPRQGEPANLALYGGCMRKPRGLTISPPLVVYEAPGRYHPDAARIYRGLTLP